MMKGWRSPLLLATLPLALAACVSQPAKPDASAEFQARSGSRVSGTAQLTDLGGEKLRVEVSARNVPPGEHGFHVHEAGDCSAPDASSARGHYNPLGRRHGHYDRPEHHAGDLPNLVADAQGNVQYSTEVQGLTLNDVVGLSLVIHADPDDYMSQPAGNSGKRIACGVIRR
jgi:Cu-Zn family superoxide dismutase